MELIVIFTAAIVFWAFGHHSGVKEGLSRAAYWRGETDKWQRRYFDLLFTPDDDEPPPDRRDDEEEKATAEPVKAIARAAGR